MFNTWVFIHLLASGDLLNFYFYRVEHKASLDPVVEQSKLCHARLIYVTCHLLYLFVTSRFETIDFMLLILILPCKLLETHIFSRYHIYFIIWFLAYYFFYCKPFCQNIFLILIFFECFHFSPYILKKFILVLKFFNLFSF